MYLECLCASSVCVFIGDVSIWLSNMYLGEHNPGYWIMDMCGHLLVISFK